MSSSSMKASSLSSSSAAAPSSSDPPDHSVAGAGTTIDHTDTTCNHFNNLEPTDNDDVDDELKELLDSALQDFDTQPGCGYATAVLGSNEEEEEEARVGGLGSALPVSAKLPPQSLSASSNQYLPAPFCGIPSTNEGGEDAPGRDLAEQLDEAMRSFIGDDPELMQNIEILAKAAESAGDSPEAQKEFADTLAKTLSSLAQNAEGLQDNLNEDELNQAFSNLGLNPGNVGVGGFDGNMGGGGGGGGGADNPDILPVMQNMMKTLLSKEVLYPSLKEISQKYPKWLEENEGKTEKELIENYGLQYKMMKTICLEFEKETTADSEDTKNNRFKRILELMQEMQELGQPPKEILGEMAPGLEFDANGFPKLLNSNEQCAIM